MDMFEEAFNHQKSNVKGAYFSAAHRRSIEAFCSNSEETISALQIELKAMPTNLQKQLLRDVEEMFDPHFAKHLLRNLPDNWIIKYFSLVLHRALHFSREKTDDITEIAEIIDKVPDFIKDGTYQSVLQFFPDPEAIVNDPNYPTKWIERYCYLVENMYSCLEKCSNWCMGIYSLKFEEA